MADYLAILTHPEPNERPLAQEVVTRFQQIADSLRRTAVQPATAPSFAPRSADVGMTGDYTEINLDAVMPGQTSDFASTSVILGGAKSIDWPKPTVASAMPERTPLEIVLQRGRIGRYRLGEKLGEGGMGAVFKAEDMADGKTVAIKVLGDRASRKPDAVRRFHKEARLLSEVNNPYVTNLLEINEDEGVLYLVMEYVAGKCLSKLLAERGPLPEAMALAFAADLCRALADAHDRAIVHRDVKPENVLLLPIAQVRQPEQELTPAAAYTVKLTDFGLARHVVESESLAVTRDGAVLGTPLYMSPEQCKGEPCDPRSDVYALGVTLFEMLTGKPPFTADTPITVLTMHCTEPVPSMRQIRPELSEGLCLVVEKALAKHPATRFANARAMLLELERLMRGEPTSIIVHPRLPERDPTKVISKEYVWELEGTPAQLWPYVSNTERWNRAIGLGAVEFHTEYDAASQGTHRYGAAKVVGLKMAWQEHPFEWIEARRYGVLREFSQGPLKWFVSVVDLEPRLGGGTRLVHHIYVEPRNFLARTAFSVQMAMAHRGMDRVYRRIDAVLAGKLGDPAVVDAFEDTAKVTKAQRQRLRQRLDRLTARGLDEQVLSQLGEFLLHAPAQEVARIRPLALARRLGVNPEQTLAACLHGVQEGLFVLYWDLLCPLCRIPSQMVDTLRALKEHGRCEACHLDYGLDFAQSVELIVRADPEIRDSEMGVFCIGGPSHSPHVVAQVRVGPGEQCDLELSLTAGAYRLRGPQLPYSRSFTVSEAAVAARWEVRLSQTPTATTLRTGNQTLALLNDTDQELVVRVERTVSRTDALTAAHASSLSLFRELFPQEVLSPGQLISMTNMTFLVTQLVGLEELATDEARLFNLVTDHFRQAEAEIRRNGGALVKTVEEGVFAAFSDTLAAVRTALHLVNAAAESKARANLSHGLKAAVQRGPAMVTTLNGHLDYFGQQVKTAWRMLALADKHEMLLGERVAAEAEVQELLQGQLPPCTILSKELLPGRTEVVERWSIQKQEG